MENHEERNNQLEAEQENDLLNAELAKLARPKEPEEFLDKLADELDECENGTIRYDGPDSLLEVINDIGFNIESLKLTGGEWLEDSELRDMIPENNILVGRDIINKLVENYSSLQKYVEKYIAEQDSIRKYALEQWIKIRQASAMLPDIRTSLLQLEGYHHGLRLSVEATPKAK